ncbi:MAG: DUF2752 domain-containing protein [Duncaniella sp.]|nr:DUF2752 domain-containing protein [Duncaniella sp.]HBI58692.1 hypothetical protein [Porphyromonadaceae bacterium]
MMSRRRRVWLAVAIVVAVAAGVYIYGTFDPVNAFFPRCVFKMATGLDCPGCGSQRAVHALLNGEFAAAVRYNALFLAEIPLLVAIVLAWVLRDRFPRFNRFVSSQPFILAVLAVIVGWTVARNIFFPL